MRAYPQFRALLLAFLLVAVSIAPATAHTNVNPTQIALFGGELQALRVSGSTLFAGIGAQLVIYDISTPAQPVQKGAILLPGAIRDLAVSGSKVYVAVNQKGLWIVDVANEASPVIAGSLSLASGATQVLIDGMTGYVASGSALVALNVSDPGNIQTTGTYSAGSAFVLAIGGIVNGHLVVGQSNGLYLVSTGSMTVSGSIASAEVLYLSMNGNFVYTAINNGGTVVVDVSNPASPSTGANFAPTATNGLVQAVGHLFVSTFSNIQIYSLTDSSSPSSVRVFNPTGGSTRSFTASGDTIYLGNQNGGFDSFGVSDINNPQLVGSVATPGFAHKAVNFGSTVYALNGGRLYILNPVSRMGPKIVGSFADPNKAELKNIAVAGTMAYLLRGFQGMSIVSLADPTNPSQVGALDYSGPNSDITVSGSLVFVADGPLGLRVIDVSNPALPQQVGSLASSSFSTQVVVFGTHAFVADSGAGLRIIDVSNPASPQETGVYKPSGSVNAVAIVNNNRVLIGVDGAGVELIDVSNRSQPAPVANVSGLANVSSVTVHGDSAFVLAQVSDPSGLQKQLITVGIGESSLTSIDTLSLDNVGQATIGPAYLLLALGFSGLAIYNNPALPTFDQFLYLPMTARSQ